MIKAHARRYSVLRHSLAVQHNLLLRGQINKIQYEFISARVICRIGAIISRHTILKRIAIRGHQRLAYVVLDRETSTFAGLRSPPEGPTETEPPSAKKRLTIRNLKAHILLRLYCLLPRAESSARICRDRVTNSTSTCQRLAVAYGYATYL